MIVWTQSKSFRIQSNMLQFQKTNSSPLKIGPPCPKRKRSYSIPIPFSGALAQSFREFSKLRGNKNPLQSLHLSAFAPPSLAVKHLRNQDPASCKVGELQRKKSSQTPFFPVVSRDTSIHRHSHFVLLVPTFLEIVVIISYKSGKMEYFTNLNFPDSGGGTSRNFLNLSFWGPREVVVSVTIKT